MESIFEDLCWMDKLMDNNKLMSSKKYKAAYDKFVADKEDFLLNLSEAQLQQFYRLSDCQSELNYIERTKSFTHGFKLGMFMYHEAFDEK